MTPPQFSFKLPRHFLTCFELLVIRLSRVGRSNLQHFRVVVQESTWSPKAGKYVAILGSYNPANPENQLEFDKAKTEEFLKNGAQPSDTIARLLKKAGISGMEKFTATYTKKKSKKAVEEKPAEEKKPEAKAEAAKEEKPAEEVKEEEKPAEEVKPEEKPAE